MDQVIAEARMGKIIMTELTWEFEFPDGFKTREEVAPQDIATMKETGMLTKANSDV